MGTYKRVEYRGEMLTLRELACLTGIDESTIRHSIRDGRSAEDAIECIKRRRVTYDVGGETLTLRQIAKRAGSISVDKVMQRIDAGETPEEIMESYQMLRLYWLKERDDADDELTEIVDARLKGRILRKAGLVG